MKIKNIINESNSTWHERYPGVTLYKGISNRNAKNLPLDGTINFRMRDQPTDTNLAFHYMVNHQSMEKFNIPIRNLFFATTDEAEASEYGKVVKITPQGNDFRIFASTKYYDMTQEIDYETPLYKLGERIIQLLWHNDIKIDYLGVDVVDIIFFDKDMTVNDNPEEFLIRKSKKFMLQFLPELTEKVTGLLVSMIQTCISDLHNMATEYISTVVEITNTKQMEAVDQKEIMIYSPSGIAISSNY